MNVWEYILLIGKTYWWVWAMILITGAMAHMAEKSPAFRDGICKATEKIFHLDNITDGEI